MGLLPHEKAWAVCARWYKGAGPAFRKNYFVIAGRFSDEQYTEKRNQRAAAVRSAVHAAPDG